MNENGDDYRHYRGHAVTDMNMLPVKQHYGMQNIMTIIKLNFQRNQLRMLLMVVAASSMLIIPLINPTSQTSQQQQKQYLFAHEVDDCGKKRS
jgi:hypothetical protein